MEIKSVVTISNCSSSPCSCFKRFMYVRRKLILWPYCNRKRRLKIPLFFFSQSITLIDIPTSLTHSPRSEFPTNDWIDSIDSFSQRMMSCEFACLCVSAALPLNSQYWSSWMRVNTTYCWPSFNPSSCIITIILHLWWLRTEGKEL